MAQDMIAVFHGGRARSRARGRSRSQRSWNFGASQAAHDKLAVLARDRVLRAGTRMAQFLDDCQIRSAVRMLGLAAGACFEAAAETRHAGGHMVSCGTYVDELTDALMSGVDWCARGRGGGGGVGGRNGALNRARKR